MSVPTGKRQEGDMQVIRELTELARYTVTACKNESVFPKSSRWLLTQKIVNEAIDALSCATRANAVKVDYKPDFEYRHAQQREAHSHLEALLTLLNVAYTVVQIEGRRIDYWTGLIVSADTKLKKWIRSDKVRYKEFC